MVRLSCLLLACAGLAAAEPSLKVASPRPNQVFQRTAKDAGTLLITGTIDALPAGEAPPAVEFRLDGGEWRKVDSPELKATPSRDGFAFSGRISTRPGMHAVEVRARRQGAAELVAAPIRCGLGEVFVVTGQSNSANHGAARTKAASDQVFSLAPPGAWQPCADPQPGASGNGGSFLPAFGDELQRRLGVPIGLVPCGIGATSVREWLPSGVPFANPPTIMSRVRKTGDGAWEADGKAYAMLVARMRSVPAFRAVLWHQGESDANQKDPTRTLPGKAYAEHLRTLIARSRHDSERTAPWFVAQVSYHGPTDMGSEDIRAAQASLWKDRSALEGPDTDALSGPLRDQGGKGVHFSAEGLKAHAHAWAEKVAPWVESQP